jgi:hypothetical protein
MRRTRQPRRLEYHESVRHRSWIHEIDQLQEDTIDNTEEPIDITG